MAHRYLRLAILTTASLLVVSVRAQDPFAVPMPEGAAAAEPADVDPFGGAARPATATPKPGEAAAGPAVEEPLVVEQLRRSNPTTPAALLRAAGAVLQFGRADEAKTYLAKFLAAGFPESELAAVTDQVGSPLILKLSGATDLQPEGRQVAELIFSAAEKQVRDPAWIAGEIKKLSAPELGVRQAALARLDASGPYVVTPILRVLADAARETEHRFLRAALARLAVSTEGPLIGALETPSDQLKAQVVAVLGRMRSQPATLHLVRLAVDPAVAAEVRQVAAAALLKTVGTVPDLYEAEKYLRQEIDSLLSGELPYRADENGQIVLWSWDEANYAVVGRTLPADDAALLLATRLAADLLALSPASNEAQRLALLTNLELLKVLGGLDQPLDAQQVLRGIPQSERAQLVNQVLDDALKANRVPAAIAAAEVLGQIGEAALLTSGGPAESPLALAMMHSDRRLRAAATRAVLSLNPQPSFPGASRVIDTLGYLIQTTGTPRMLVGHPRGEEAQTLIAWAGELGLEGDAAYTGRRLIEGTAASSDIELILIGDAIDGPPVRELVQLLRQNYRTAQIPIGVMAKSDNLDSLRFFFRDDPFTSVSPRIYSLPVAANEVRKLRAIAGRNQVPASERVAEAQAALAAVSKLAESPAGYSDWNVLRLEPAVINALNSSSLTAAAAKVLGSFGTPGSQTALVDFVSQTARPLTDRQAAAAAFAAAVKRRGLNLTQRKIVEQYERYNASETLDRETQVVLGSILDTIEAPTADERATASTLK
ncbi:MAG: hypothetical protein WD872_01885 [Pirellulaceae bacterium]